MCTIVLWRYCMISSLVELMETLEEEGIIIIDDYDLLVEKIEEFETQNSYSSLDDF